MSIIRRIIVVLGFVMLLTVVLGGVGLYLLTRSTDLEEEMRPVGKNLDVQQSFTSKIDILEDEIKAAVAAGEQREVSITLTESEASIMISEMMREAITKSSDEEDSGEMKIEAIVNFEEDLIRTVAKMEFYGVEVNGAVEMIAIADEQGLSMQMQNMEMGQIPFAGSVKDRIMTSFNESHTHINLDDLHIDIEKGLRVELTNLFFCDGEMVVTGKAG